MSLGGIHIVSAGAVVLGLFLTWMNWTWKQKWKKEMEERLKDWDKCFLQRLDYHEKFIQRITENRLKEFHKELKLTSPRKTALQKPKETAPLKIKKIR